MKAARAVELGRKRWIRSVMRFGDVGLASTRTTEQEGTPERYNSGRGQAPVVIEGSL